MAPKLLRTKCQFCHKGFNTYDPEKVYCNSTCETRDQEKLKVPSMTEKGLEKWSYNKRRTWKKMGWLQCNHCGEPYKPPEDMREAVQTWDEDRHYCYWYCSGACQATANQNSQIHFKHCICVICGDEFISMAHGHSEKYCSPECKKEWTARNNEKKNIANRKKALTKPKKKRKPIAFEALNRIAEEKRLREEWKRLVK